MSYFAELESLLFVAGESGVSLSELGYVLDLSTSTINQMLCDLNETYLANENCGLTIIETGNRYILSTKKEMAVVLQRYAQSPVAPTLSKAALEVLSIIAYKQPVTRVEIDVVRGVQSTGAIQKLITYGLIKELGRVEGPGRAILYGTTDYFLDYFGLNSPEDLPSIEEMEVEMSQEEEMDLFYDRFQQTLNADEELEKRVEEEG